jgi:uracil-DNA glycosylase family 4
MTTRKPIADIFSQVIEQQRELGLGELRLDCDVVTTLLPPKPSKRPLRDPAAPTKALADYCEQINNCTKCRLHEGRNKFVFGVGNPAADVMFIGEGPGHDEDMKGEPFVGRGGQLLDRILAAIKFDRKQIYIANIVKCRPPNNRDPQPDEMSECMPYLKKQIEIINPRFICCLGRVAAQALLGVTTPLGKMRGRFMDFEGRKLMVTYHPAALLRFQEYKRDTWEDVQMLRKEYDEWMTL